MRSDASGHSERGPFLFARSKSETRVPGILVKTGTRYSVDILPVISVPSTSPVGSTRTRCH